MSQIAAIFNPGSGGYDPGVKESLRELFRGSGHELVITNSEILEGPGRYGRRSSTIGSLASILAEGKSVRNFVVGSGDGGVHDIVNGIMDSGERPEDFKVAILPMGSGNDLAAALGINNVEEGLEAIETRFVDARYNNLRQVDVFNVGAGDFSRYGINSADAAFGAHLVDWIHNTRRGRWLKRKLGGRSYATAVPFAFGSYVSKDLLIHADTEHGWMEQGAENNFLANLQNSPIVGDEMLLAPRARFDDGVLDFVIKSTGGFWETIRLLRQTKEGNRERYDGVQHIRNVKSVEVRDESGKGFRHACIDGELYHFDNPADSVRYEITGRQIGFVGAA